MKTTLIVPLALLLFFIACNNTSPATSVAENEEEFQSDLDVESEMRTEVRQSVNDFVKASLPAWKLKGLSIEPYQYNVFWAAADIEKDNRGLVINLAVRKFFPESGNPYWKVVSLRKTLEEQLHEMNDADMWKKLNDAASSDSGG